MGGIQSRSPVFMAGAGRGDACVAPTRCLAPVRLVGLDIDRDLLDEAGRRLDSNGTRAELIPGDVRRLPFPSSDFDLILDFGTCFHIDRPDEALREIARVLAPGGIFATETKLNQLFSHPLRSRGRSLPWSAVSALGHRRHAGLWQSRYRLA